MKKKHIIALVCVLALAVSLMSSFTYAAPPETAEADAGNGARMYTEYEVVRVRTYLYNSPSTNSGYVFDGNIPVGHSVYRVSSSNYYDRSDNDRLFYKVSYGSYTGYVIANHVELRY